MTKPTRMREVMRPWMAKLEKTLRENHNLAGPGWYSPGNLLVQISANAAVSNISRKKEGWKWVGSIGTWWSARGVRPAPSSPSWRQAVKCRGRWKLIWRVHPWWANAGQGVRNRMGHIIRVVVLFLEWSVHPWWVKDRTWHRGSGWLLALLYCWQVQSTIGRSRERSCDDQKIFLRTQEMYGLKNS